MKRKYWIIALLALLLTLVAGSALAATESVQIIPGRMAGYLDPDGKLTISYNLLEYEPMPLTYTGWSYNVKSNTKKIEFQDGITAIGDTWCAVTYQEVSGYCMIQYLEFALYE